MGLINQSDSDRRWKHLPLNIRKLDLVVDSSWKFGLLVGRIDDDFFSQTNMVKKEALVSSVYTAISRVRSELYVPEDFDTWVKQLSSN